MRAGGFCNAGLRLERCGVWRAGWVDFGSL